MKKGIVLLLVVASLIAGYFVGHSRSANVNQVQTGQEEIQNTGEPATPEEQESVEQEENTPEPEEEPSGNESDEENEPDEPTDDPTDEPIPEMPDNSTFEIFFLDVGQGDAACVLCDGKAMMIDGGTSAESNKIFSFLESHGVSSLDYIVASHADADHVGGLSGALNYVIKKDAAIGTVYCTVTQDDSEPFQDFVKYLSRVDREITVPKAGDTFFLGSAKVTIIYPDYDTPKGDNTSIVLRIEYGTTSFLFTGDCETEDEANIFLSGYNVESDVLKIAHHGSRYSTSEVFLESVGPEYAVISVGGSNTYGHPTEDVLSNLSNMGVKLFRTDMHGDIHCTSDGENIRFEVAHNTDVDPYIVIGGYDNWQEPVPEPDPEVTYIANKNSKKIHYPTCSSVGQMKESNKLYWTGTIDELLDMGYVPCGRCHPN